MDARQVIARYEVTRLYGAETAWTDIREAQPRCRIRAKDPQDKLVVLVSKVGAIEVTGGKHEIDTYNDPQYKSVKDEVKAK